MLTVRETSFPNRAKIPYLFEHRKCDRELLSVHLAVRGEVSSRAAINARSAELTIERPPPATKFRWRLRDEETDESGERGCLEHQLGVEHAIDRLGFRLGSRRLEL